MNTIWRRVYQCLTISHQLKLRHASNIPNRCLLKYRRQFCTAHRPRQHSHSSGYNSFTHRTHLCGDLNKTQVGEKVTIIGWLQYRRAGKFLLLRDWRGLVQVIVPDSLQSKIDVDDIPYESVVKVTGLVAERPDGQQNRAMTTGEIEVMVDELSVVNRCKSTLPFEIREFFKTKESLRLEHRYLDIRSNNLQENLRLRSDMIMRMREFLSNDHGFVEVETPTLFRRTPGGAREFIVPSHFDGHFYSLPQSPQQFKQLLMVGGIDRYYQVARCYRDEKIKTDRQPEFTQLDLEMSFIDQESVFSLIQNLIWHSWPKSKPDLPSRVFPRMSYQEAMARYGIDKPDTRFNWLLHDISDLFASSNFEVFRDIIRDGGTIQSLKIPLCQKHLSRKEIETILNSTKEKISQHVTVFKSKGDKLSSSISKYLDEETKNKMKSQLEIQDGDVILISAGTGWTPYETLGNLRLAFANSIESKGVNVREDGFNFLWVVDFPLFLPSESDPSILESGHHPFTAPQPGDESLIYESPKDVKGQHYDLVLNGNEIGGGSLRIHNRALQEYVIKDILHEDSSELQHLMDALESGCPPHGGIALGLDRLFAIICGASSIRDVIAFPKAADGKDLMSKAPVPVLQEQLDFYNISVKSQ